MSTPKFDYAKYLRQPFEVSIETLTLCNATCNFCPYPTLERKGTRMPQGMWDSLMSQLTAFKHPFFLSPFKVNEPFADKTLLGKLKYLYIDIPLARLRLFTNGSLLTEEIIQDIAALRNVEHLWISLNSVDAAEYEFVMGLKFERTALRLDQLHRMCVAGIFTHPVVVSRVTKSPVAGRANIVFHQFCAHRWPLFRTFDIKQDGWLGYVDPWNPTIPATPCGRWFELSILSTGVVSLCCMDGKGEFSIGNLHENSMLEIYNRGTWLQRRELMNSREFYHPCSTCTY